MIDLGRKPEYSQQTSPAVPKEPEITYPSFSIYDCKTQLPIDPNMLGEEVTATVKLKLKSMSKSSNTKGTKHDYSFDVMGIDIDKKLKHMSSGRIY